MLICLWDRGKKFWNQLYTFNAARNSLKWQKRGIAQDTSWVLLWNRKKCVCKGKKSLLNDSNKENAHRRPASKEQTKHGISIFHMSKIALYIYFLAYNKINVPQKTEKASGT